MKAENTKPKLLTKYQDYKSLITCIREAGHVVVGHAMGWKIRRVAAGRGTNTASFEPVPVSEPYMAETREARNALITNLRTAMSIISAGDVSGTLHQVAVETGRLNRKQLLVRLKPIVVVGH